MEYPDHKTYAALYARFFRKDRFEKLLEGLDFQNKLVIDLCCGAGQVSMEAMNRGAYTVIAIDESRDMISQELYDRPNVIVGHTSAEKALSSWHWKPADIVICQQAVNYWLTRQTAKQLHEVMHKDGVFAFNTFVNRPSETPKTMSYELGGRRYWEYSQLIGDMVHHVQACDGIPPHITAFRWLSEEEILTILGGLFEIRPRYYSSSVIYRCTPIAS